MLKQIILMCAVFFCSSMYGQAAAELRPEMDEHVRRWHFPTSVKAWEKAVAKTEHFLLKRPAFLLQDATRHFGVPVEVFPNPVMARNVHIKLFTWSEENALDCQLFNAAGQLVQQEQISITTGHQQIEFPLDESLATGMYFLRLAYDGNLDIVKLHVGTNYE